MNQYEIDFKQGYDTANEEWTEKVKQAKEEMKECSYSLACFNADVFDEDERVVDLDNALIILDKLVSET